MNTVLFVNATIGFSENLFLVVLVTSNLPKNFVEPFEVCFSTSATSNPSTTGTKRPMMTHCIINTVLPQSWMSVVLRLSTVNNYMYLINIIHKK